MYRLSDKLISFIEPEAIDANAILQSEKLSRMPFVFDHVALMPELQPRAGAAQAPSVAQHQGGLVDKNPKQGGNPRESEVITMEFDRWPDLFWWLR